MASKSIIRPLINRGMVQCITVAERKPGAGRTPRCRRSPDLRLPETGNHPSLPKMYEVLHRVEESPSAFYCGFDPTADSLHLGHLTVITPLLHLASRGRKVIALVGGATSRLGDPSGKAENRQIIQNDVINRNSDSLKALLSQIFRNFSKKNNIDESLFSILDNSMWYGDMTLGDYMTVIAPKFKLTEMFSRSVVSSRLKAKDSRDDMRFSEFVYQTFQAYDWFHLYTHYDCRVQIGGYDQLGNIEDGYALIWKKASGKPDLAGIGVPLVVTKSGEKLGKTSGNAIWLDNKKTSKDDMLKYLKSLSNEELDDLSLKLCFESTDKMKELSSHDLVDAVLEEVSYLTS